MCSPGACADDAVLDALALCEARLRGDGLAQRTIFSHCDSQAVASVLAEMFTHFLTVTMDDPLAATAKLRSNYAARGS
jgi:hypothetical protein